MSNWSSTYTEAIKEAMSKFSTDAVVMTGGYDQNIVDHYNEEADYEPTVYTIECITQRDSEYAKTLTVYDGESGKELARIIDGDDYKRLGYNYL